MPNSQRNNLEFDPPPPTLIEILKQRALHEPDRTAYIYLVDGETEEISLTYYELDQAARVIATGLQAQDGFGERALLIYPTGLEFLKAFFGCLYAGVIAVPVYPPRKDKDFPRIFSVLKNSKAKFLLTTETSQVRLNKLTNGAVNSDFKKLKWLITDQVDQNDPDWLAELATKWIDPEITGDQLAFLQYTSGSTGQPKGVMVSHGNLIYNQGMMDQSFERSKECVIVSWLPLYHDMGLIGNVLHPLYKGMKCVFMAPEIFLQKPFRWLQAISRYRATTGGGAPNFAYELCAERVSPEQIKTLDLSCWQFSLVGSDTVRKNTLERFISTFAPCGFRKEVLLPAYGLAEATLIVSGGCVSHAPIYYTVKAAGLEQHQVLAASPDDKQSRTLVGCGHTLLDQKIKIVDPNTLKQCTPDQVGEIWVSGENVAKGYWKNDSATQSTFQARMTDSDEGPFLRTGDLGFLKEDELFITGRLKNMIIIRGRNHYPEDIEATTEKNFRAVRTGCCAAFTVEQNEEERLIVVAELERRFISSRRVQNKDVNPDQRRRPKRRQLNIEDNGIGQTEANLKLDECIQMIRQAIVRNHDIQVHSIVLIRPVSLPKTTSGKVRRFECRNLFLNQQLTILKQWTQPSSKASPEQALPQLNQTKDSIQSWLISRLSTEMKLPQTQIDPQLELYQYGLDSMVAVSVSGDLENWLGRKISPTLFYNYPSIQSAADHLANIVEVEPAIQKRIQESDQDTSIAVIGVACRLPKAENPETFWELLLKGADAISEVPSDRWDLFSLYDPRPGTPNKMNTRWGGFIDQVDQFDPFFFGISPKEASNMDPQQRMLLEVSWEVLENSGLNPAKLKGSKTGVFIGISNNDYGRLALSHSENFNAYQGAGSALSIASNRISYQYDFRGPSVAVDTACSSSLVSVHLACQSLRQGESTLAIAGGVNLILSPEATIIFSQADMMAADGRCKTFDAAADGYVRSEGCGLMVLKCLPDALRDGDNILAVIRGSAINQDGRSNGITAPNGPSQQAVISQALENAGISAAQISYVEAHGTGTALGDPIEMESLKAVLMKKRASDSPCLIGSVKTNMGHLESAAGITGLIKVVLALQKGQIPGNLHFNRLNPHISLENTTFSIPTTAEAWPVAAEKRLAGISSFGFGGTNAHMILEEHISRPDIAHPEASVLNILTLSAKSQNALQTLAKRYDDYLRKTAPTKVNDITLASVCYTANTGRTHFPYRLAIVGDSIVQMSEALAAYVNECPNETTRLGYSKHIKSPKILFYFSDRGTKHERGAAHQFALQYAFARLWQTWGIKPDAVIGHGVGEYVAACLAGVFSSETALKLLAAQEQLAGESGSSENSPSQFKAIALKQHYSLPVIPMINSLKGEYFPDNEIPDAEYWIRQFQTKSQIAKGLDFLQGEGFGIFVEIGPTATLQDFFKKQPDNNPAVKILALCNETRDWGQILNNLSILYTNGIDINWIAFYKDHPDLRKVSLPNYPFQKKRYWFEEKKSVQVSNLKPLQLLYDLQWEALDLSVAGDKTASLLSLPGFLGIFADDTGVGEMLSEQLTACQKDAVLIYPGEAYQKMGEGKFMINPNRPEDFNLLLKNISQEKKNPCLGFIHLWSLNTDLSQDLSEKRLQMAKTNGCLTILYLLQALTGNEQFSISGLWLVTRGAQAVRPNADTIVSAEQSLLWGLGKGIPLEYPELKVGLIDLDPHRIEKSASWIMAEIEQPDDEYQVAYRNNQRFVARITADQEQTTPTQVDFSWQKAATYLITGGLGKLGLRLAKSMVALGARHLVLMARRQLPEDDQQTKYAQGSVQEGQISAVRELEEQGAFVKIVSADVCNSQEVSEVLKEMSRTMPPLKGVIHAAGIVRQDTIKAMTPEALNAVLDAKVTGTMILHRLTQSLSLDCFLMFSSISSVWGSKQIAHYAAANAFLDMFTHYRRTKGFPATTLNWGPWSGGGMTSSEEQNQLARIGIHALDPEQALTAMTNVLTTNAPQKIIAKVDWNRLSSLYASVGLAKLFEAVVSEEITKNPGINKTGDLKNPQKNEWYKKLDQVTSKDQLKILTDFLKQQVAEIMECDPSDIDLKAGFFDMGMDSLMAVDLKNRLETQFNDPLPTTLTFDYPNLERLAQYLLMEIFPKNGAESEIKTIPGEAKVPQVPKFKPPTREGKTGKTNTSSYQSGAGKLSKENKRWISETAIMEIKALSEDEIEALIDEELKDF